MTVPPVQRSPKASAMGPDAGVRFPWLLDSVLGLLIVVTLPLAIIAIPNTVSVVSGLLPEGVDSLALMRAHGLALPAMILTVPLAAVALRLVKVAHLLVAGLALLAMADAAGGFAGSTLLVAVLRILHGVGAGLLVPATLVAAWERPLPLRAVWAGMLAFSMLAAQALALWPLDDAGDWRITLQPYPLLTGIALALAAVYLVVWVLQGRPAAPGPRARERSRLLLTAAPAAGIAVVAISAASADWSAGLVIALGVLAVVALIAMASTGVGEGRTLAYVAIAVGVVLLPSMAQITDVEMRGLGGPGLIGLWVPFGVAGVLALVAAVAVRGSASAAPRWLVPLGLLAMVVGLCSVRVAVPSPDGMVLMIPFTLLAAGAAVALTAALGQSGIGTALYGLSLCFPGVLAGFVLATGIQMMMLQGVTEPQQLVDRFVGTLHLWSLIGGFFVVAVILLAALLARRPGASVVDVASGTDSPDEGGGAAAGTAAPSADGGAAPARERVKPMSAPVGDQVESEAGSSQAGAVEGVAGDASAPEDGIGGRGRAGRSAVAGGGIGAFADHSPGRGDSPPDDSADGGGRPQADTSSQGVSRAGETAAGGDEPAVSTSAQGGERPPAGGAESSAGSGGQGVADQAQGGGDEPGAGSGEEDVAAPAKDGGEAKTDGESAGSEVDSESTGPITVIPPVPPQAQSPEDSVSP